MNSARANFDSYDPDAAYIDIGKGSIILKIWDVLTILPALIFYSTVHMRAGIKSHWTELGLDSAIDVTSYFVVTDPEVSRESSCRSVASSPTLYQLDDRHRSGLAG